MIFQMFFVISSKERKSREAELLWKTVDVQHSVQ